MSLFRSKCTVRKMIKKLTGSEHCACKGTLISSSLISTKSEFSSTISLSDARPGDLDGWDVSFPLQLSPPLELLFGLSSPSSFSSITKENQL